MSKQPQTSATTAVSNEAQKLRQTQAEYDAARNSSWGKVRPMSSSKMYVCRRCQANFQTGHGKPDPRLPGVGKCDKCLGVVAASLA